jgi:DNA-binding CsgD family transcriptional regulator
MLNDQFEEAQKWGQRAVDLARQFNETEIYAHALNNIATSLLLSSNTQRGHALMAESLELALKHGYHEQAARVYTNMADFALANRELTTAQAYIDQGLAFDDEHDLDSWLHYLRGCKARLLLLRGQVQAAFDLAQDILRTPNQTLVMRLPAATVLAQAAVRLRHASAQTQLLGALKEAMATGESQRIAPIRISLAEAAWLAGNDDEVMHHVDTALLGQEAKHFWDLGELLAWANRAGHSRVEPQHILPEPVALECSNKYSEAADTYARLGLPFESAVAKVFASNVAPIGRKARFERVHGLMAVRETQTQDSESTIIAHVDQYGLTPKEQQVVKLLRTGASNGEIASKLNRSVRTIEHHVAAILSKLGVNSRAAVLARTSTSETSAINAGSAT